VVRFGEMNDRPSAVVHYRLRHVKGAVKGTPANRSATVFATLTSSRFASRGGEQRGIQIDLSELSLHLNLAPSAQRPFGAEILIVTLEYTARRTNPDCDQADARECERETPQVQPKTPISTNALRREQRKTSGGHECAEHVAPRGRRCKQQPALRYCERYQCDLSAVSWCWSDRPGRVKRSRRL
jgi:hypothetical protein